jgi:hypothetical protein
MELTMAPRSEFTRLALTSDGKVALEGDIDTTGPVHVHWLVEQNGVVAAGVKPSDGGAFDDIEAKGQSWRAGQSANAVGMQVGVGTTASGRAGFETFTWAQTLVLER